MAIKIEVVIFTDLKGMGATASLSLSSNGYTQDELAVANHLQATVDRMFAAVFKTNVSRTSINQESNNVH